MIRLLPYLRFDTKKVKEETMQAELVQENAEKAQRYQTYGELLERERQLEIRIKRITNPEGAVLSDDHFPNTNRN